MAMITVQRTDAQLEHERRRLDQLYNLLGVLHVVAQDVTSLAGELAGYFDAIADTIEGERSEKAYWLDEGEPEPEADEGPGTLTQVVQTVEMDVDSVARTIGATVDGLYYDLTDLGIRVKGVAVGVCPERLTEELVARASTDEPVVDGEFDIVDAARRVYLDA